MLRDLEGALTVIQDHVHFILRQRASPDARSSFNKIAVERSPEHLGFNVVLLLDSDVWTLLPASCQTEQRIQIVPVLFTQVSLDQNSSMRIHPVVK